LLGVAILFLHVVLVWEYAIVDYPSPPWTGIILGTCAGVVIGLSTVVVLGRHPTRTARHKSMSKPIFIGLAVASGVLVSFAPLAWEVGLTTALMVSLATFLIGVSIRMATGSRARQRPLG
jgi:hypothetical protein